MEIIQSHNQKFSSLQTLTWESFKTDWTSDCSCGLFIGLFTRCIFGHNFGATLLLAIFWLYWLTFSVPAIESATVPNPKRYYMQNGSHKYRIRMETILMGCSHLRKTRKFWIFSIKQWWQWWLMVDDTCGFTPPATGYRSLTGRQAPVKLQSEII